MTILHRGAKGTRTLDLHNPDGSHIGTARTANGRDIEQHERRIRAHLAEHREYELSRGADECPFINWGVACTLPAGHDGDHDPGPDAFPPIP